MSEPSPIYEVVHHPDAELDYGFDWAAHWLADSPGDTVGDGQGATTAPEWTLLDGNGDALDEADTAEIFDEDTIDGVATAWVRNLVDGNDYILTCVITLDPSGRKDARSLRLRCRR